MNSAQADVQRVRRPVLCFPTFMSSGPISPLLATHLQAVLPHTIPALGSPYLAMLSLSCDTQCALFSFFHKNVTMATRRRGPTSQIHNTLSRHSRKFLPTASTWQSFFIFKFLTAYLASVPRLIWKKWKSSTEFVMSEDLVAQAVRPRLLVFESRFLALKPAENTSDLHERNKFSQVAGKEEDTIVCWKRIFHSHRKTTNQVTKWGTCLVGTFQAPWPLS